jgi:hypothetical protein
MQATHLGVGGLRDGCPAVGGCRDYAPDQIPGDLRDTYSGSALMNPGSRTVVGPDGPVVADASVMLEVSRTNTNIPTIMIAERIAETVRQRAFAS